MKSNEVTKYFTQVFSPELFEDYAPNGIQIEGKEEIKKLAFAVSATHESIQLALDWKADGLVVHHGVFWKHAGARPLTGAWGKRVSSMVRAEINLWGYHLPLDAHPQIGNAKSVADLLELENLEGFGAYKKQFLGMKGKFSKPIKACDLQEKLNKLFGKSIILAQSNLDQPINTLGIITGGANNDWVKALEDGLDAYLTGEISEYNWHDAKEAGIHYFAAGHHATEKFGIMNLMNKVKNDLNLEVKFFDSKNPV